MKESRNGGSIGPERSRGRANGRKDEGKEGEKDEVEAEVLKSQEGRRLKLNEARP